MTRQLTKSDLLIEINADGNFFYIQPDIPLFNANRLTSDVTITNPDDLKGFYPDQSGTYYENISVTGAKIGLGALSQAGSFRVYDYTFFDTQSDTVYASAIQRGTEHVGNAQFLRVYANGKDVPIVRTEDYLNRNTDFFDNNNLRFGDGNIAYFRDITAKNFADAIFDNKNVVYISNATISDAYRVLRAHDNATIIIVNSVINSGSGNHLAMLEGITSRIYYYNCLWNGRSTIDPRDIDTPFVSSSERAAFLSQTMIKLDYNPLLAVDPFFSQDEDRYRAQVSVNGGAWININLPNDGWLGQAIGDTMVRLPDLGNGTYRVRAWAVDANGNASGSVSTDSFRVTNSSFDYVGGSTAMDAPAPWMGTAEADRMHGRTTDDEIYGSGGNDQISGNAGNDRLFGGSGNDVVDGGIGNDTVDGGDGNDILYGGPGNDWLIPGTGNDTVHGGDGNDTIDYSNKSIASSGYTIDLARGTFRRTDGTGSTDRFTSIENVVASHSGDILIGTGTANRMMGGRGNDTITTGSGPDVVIFDNTADFGSDRVTDFSYSDQLWFTYFTDLGSDNLARITSTGRFSFDLGTGGERAVNLGQADRWIQYIGRNADGYYAYKLFEGPWPDRDILPSSKDPNNNVTLTRPTVNGETISFANAAFESGGYTIDLPQGRFFRTAAPTEVLQFESQRFVIGTTSNDRILGDYQINRITGGLGNDTMTGNGGRDIYIFDNAVDFGADRITDFGFGRELWFTRFTDLGSDNLARVASNGTFAFSFGTSGGRRAIDFGNGDRWLEYSGRNAEGFFVYRLYEGQWPTQDILPDSSSTITLPDPVMSGSGTERRADFSAATAYFPGYTIDLVNDRISLTDRPTVNKTFEAARHVTGSSSNDTIIGDTEANRIEGGRGDDIMTGGGGRDTYIFDNRVDFGSDRITDFRYNRELWFTQFTDLGADNLAQVSASGTFEFSFGSAGGRRALDIGFAGRWMEYLGENAEGYHAYRLYADTAPTQDVLPGEIPAGNVAPSLADPVISGTSLTDTLADFSNAAAYGPGYVINLNTSLFAFADQIASGTTFPTARHVVGTSSNDTITADHHPNRIDGGRGNDVMTGGSGRDTFIFDNAVDVGNDRITDFSFSDELWFTRFVDLGSDRLARIGADGLFNFGFGTNGGTRSVEIGHANRWMEYMGQNAEGYHVYALDTDPWPSVDILPA